MTVWPMPPEAREALLQALEEGLRRKHPGAVIERLPEPNINPTVDVPPAAPDPDVGARQG